MSRRLIGMLVSPMASLAIFDCCAGGGMRLSVCAYS